MIWIIGALLVGLAAGGFGAWLWTRTILHEELALAEKVFAKAEELAGIAKFAGGSPSQAMEFTPDDRPPFIVRVSVKPHGPAQREAPILAPTGIAGQ